MTCNNICPGQEVRNPVLNNSRLKSLLQCFVLFVGVIFVTCFFANMKSSLDVAIDAVVKIEVVDRWGQKWIGSGTFIKDDLVLTAKHVVEGANEVWIIWSDGARHKAQDWEVSKKYDLSLVNIYTIKKEKKLNFTPSVVGEDVWSCSAALGYFPVLTKGVVSSEAIELGEEKAIFFLVDSLMNPGSSGGAVLNGKGDIVGVCVVAVGRFNWYGGCVPVKDIEKFLEEASCGPN